MKQTNRIDFHIRLERSGGVAGIQMKKEVNTRNLDGEEIRSLQDLLERSGLFREAPPTPADSSHPDQILYAISVEYSGRQDVLEWKGTRLPESLRELVRYVERKGTSGESAPDAIPPS
ncbi:MAG: protealysin inhibitor emfourin [Bacteroidales bacterium]